MSITRSVQGGGLPRDVLDIACKPVSALGRGSCGTPRGRRWRTAGGSPHERGRLSTDLVDQWWLVVGSAVAVVGLALVVRRRAGTIPRLSWLDAAMAGFSIGALAAVFGASGATIVAAGGIAG